LRDRFVEEWFAINPTAAVAAGRHEFDGQVPDLTSTGYAARVALFRRYLDAARAVQAIAGSDDAYERDLLVWYCDRQLFWLEQARWPWVNPESYSGVSSPSAYVTRAYAPLDVRMVALARWALAMPRALAEMRANLETPLPRVYAARAIARYDGLVSYLSTDVPSIFAGAGSAAARAELKQALEGAVAAFADTAAWLRTEQSRGTDSFALGRKRFDELLARSERVAITTSELDAWNEADIARNMAALQVACARFAPDALLAQCVARVDADKPAEGPVAAATAQLEDLEQFLRSRQIVSIPLPDRARVAVSPPYNRANSAYIERPGPFEPQGLPATYYIAPPDPAWTAEEQLAYLPGTVSLMFTSIHEVWPGHFLQGLHARAFAPPLATLVSATTFSEGWAHYAEELMWEAGFGDGEPRVHIAQLQNALWRNVRVRSAIGLHTKGMTLAESERDFREVAFLDPGNARQQAARGAYDPDYFAYTLGKLQIRALRDEWTAARGGRADWRAFHDALLARGAPPLSLAREYMALTPGPVANE
jgi:uncharacterized protein (DUF885 family)